MKVSCMNPLARYNEIRQSTGLPTRCVNLVHDYGAKKSGEGYLIALSPNRELIAFATPSDGYCALFNTRSRTVEKVTCFKHNADEWWNNDMYIKSLEFVDDATLTTLVGPHYDHYQGRLYIYNIFDDAQDCIEDVVRDKDVALLQRDVPGRLLLYSRITENIVPNGNTFDFDIAGTTQSVWRLDKARKNALPAKAPLVHVPDFRKVAADDVVSEQNVGLSLVKNPELGFIKPIDWVMLREGDSTQVTELLSQGLSKVEAKEREVRVPKKQKRRKVSAQTVNVTVGAAPVRLVATKKQCIIG